MANKKLSLKVLTEKKPASGSYEPVLSPKTAPNSFSHPEDALDLDTYIGQVAPAFVLPNVIELDGIKEATSNQGVIVDNVVMKNGSIFLSYDSSLTPGPTHTIDAATGKCIVSHGATAALGTRTVTITNNLANNDSVVLASIGVYTGAGTPVVKQVTPGPGNIVIEIYNASATDALNSTFALIFAILA